MSTLKICTSKIFWICGIKNVIQLGDFCMVPEGKEFNQKDVYEAAHRQKLIPDTSSVVHQVAFEFGDDNECTIWGVALQIRTLDDDHENEIWLIPRRSAFLMSDSGATIDRI